MRGYRQPNGPARDAQGARRRDALLHVPRAGRIDCGAARRRSLPTRSACTPTPFGSTSTGSAKRASSTSSRCTGAPSAGRQHLYFAGAGCARSRLRSAELHAALRAARRARRAGRRRRRRSHRDRPAWGADAGRRTRSRSCVKALAAEMDRLGFGPDDRDLRERPPTSRSCTARSGSWPRPTRSSSATSTVGSARGRRRGRGGSSRGLRDVVRPRTRAGSRSGRVS